MYVHVNPYTVAGTSNPNTPMKKVMAAGPMGGGKAIPIVNPMTGLRVGSPAGGR